MSRTEWIFIPKISEIDTFFKILKITRECYIISKYYAQLIKMILNRNVFGKRITCITYILQIAYLQPIYNVVLFPHSSNNVIGFVSNEPPMLKTSYIKCGQVNVDVVHDIAIVVDMWIYVDLPEAKLKELYVQVLNEVLKDLKNNHGIKHLIFDYRDLTEVYPYKIHVVNSFGMRKFKKHYIAYMNV